MYDDEPYSDEERAYLNTLEPFNALYHYDADEWHDQMRRRRMPPTRKQKLQGVAWVTAGLVALTAFGELMRFLF